jgi:hypothetical protein
MNRRVFAVQDHPLARNSDLLVGGSTVYDRHDAALRAILDQWERNDISYFDRVDVVRHGAPPLTNIADLVFDDLDEDTLDGRTQLDWYFEGLGDDLIPDPVPQIAVDEVIEALL